MSDYIRLLRINLINVYRRDTAYFANNWSNVVSTFVFILTQILFIEFIFGNITQLGGFSKNDIYFLTLIGQTSFFIMSTSFIGASALSQDINTGTLDFDLLKPIPHRWHIYTKSISFLTTLRDAIPSVVPIIIIIDFSELEIEFWHLVAGLMIFLMGIVIDHLLIYSLASVAFWTASADFILYYFWAERTQTKVPFDSLPNWFQSLVFFGLPAYISAALSASVMLGYSSATLWSGITFVAMIAWIVFANFLWHKALRQYSSASS